MKLIKQYPLTSFLVLAYAITWTLQLSAVFLAPAQTLYGVLPWAIAIFLIRKFGRENLSPHPRPSSG